MTKERLSLPDWLPRPVADYARALMAERELMQLDSGHRQRLKRLTTDSKMEFVWVQVEREMKNHAAHSNVHPDKLDYAAETWLRGYLFVAVTADHNATFWQSAQSAREQKATMIRLREIACELIKLLDDPLPSMWTPWDRLTAAVDSARNAPASIQDHLNRLARKTYRRYWSQGESVGNEFPSDLQAAEGIPLYPLEARVLLGDLRSQLEGLAVLAEMSVADDGGPKRGPPNKTKHLTSTVYIRNLANYVKGFGLRAKQPGHQQAGHQQAGFHLYQIIAITTNIALNLSGREEIRPDTVRKLFVEDR